MDYKLRIQLPYFFGSKLGHVVFYLYLCKKNQNNVSPFLPYPLFDSDLCAALFLRKAQAVNYEL